ncbi:transcriptional regulator with XRE-family HTH domain [Rhodococcus sp. PvR044]|uniref:hypothetical protein n=1 Tax=Rhodococcus sp. PvR044 TaxID=3156402 RepID=UPI00339ADC01
MTQPSWSTETTQRIAQAIRTHRGARSAQWLSDMTEKVGYRVARSRISDLETGRRNRIDVTELIVIAAALNVAPVLLIYPDIPAGSVEVLPGLEGTSWGALKWFEGVYASPLHSREDSADFELENNRNQHLADLRTEEDLFGAWSEEVLEFDRTVNEYNRQKEDPSFTSNPVLERLVDQASKALRDTRTQLEDHRKRMLERGHQPLGREGLEDTYGFLDTPEEEEKWR